MKKIIYIDMDGVIIDYYGAARETTFEDRAKLGFYLDMKPIPGAIEAAKFLCTYFEVYILSTAPWDRPLSWTEKRLSIEKYFGNLFEKRLILSNDKSLFIGDYIIDDRKANGVSEFKGEHIHFGSKEFPNWDAVLKYFSKENKSNV